MLGLMIAHPLSSYAQRPSPIPFHHQVRVAIVASLGLIGARFPSRWCTHRRLLKVRNTRQLPPASAASKFDFTPVAKKLPRFLPTNPLKTGSEIESV